MASPNPIDYFCHDLWRYNGGDVRALLHVRLPQAGPLLNTVLAGVDAAGGFVYGFKNGNSRDRSTKFLVGYIGVASKMQAEFIYRFARCGISHQAATKPGVEFSVDYTNVSTEILSLTQNEVVHLDVVVLAYAHLAALWRLKGELAHPKKEFHLPHYDMDDDDRLRVAVVEELRQQSARGPAAPDPFQGITSPSSSSTILRMPDGSTSTP